MKSIIEQVAKQNNTSPENVRREMEIVIDYAWDNNSTMRELFKNKPSPEEFILIIANGVRGK